MKIKSVIVLAVLFVSQWALAIDGLDRPGSTSLDAMGYDYIKHDDGHKYYEYDKTVLTVELQELSRGTVIANEDLAHSLLNLLSGLAVENRKKEKLEKWAAVQEVLMKTPSCGDKIKAEIAASSAILKKPLAQVEFQMFAAYSPISLWSRAMGEQKYLVVKLFFNEGDKPKFANVRELACKVKR